MGNHFANRTPVRNEYAVKAHTAAQLAPDEGRISGGGNSVGGTERVHDGGGSRFYARLKRRQNPVVQRVGAVVGRVVVASGDPKSISSEVLQTGRKGRGVAQVGTLKTVHTRFGDARTEVGIFARTLHNAAPARVAADVDHGRKGPVDAVGRSLAGGSSGGILYRLHVPARGFGERNRRKRLVAVDHIQAKQKGNPQARLFDRHFLQGANLVHPCDIEYGTYSAALQRRNACLNPVVALGHGAGGVPKPVVLVGLTDEFLEGHQGQHAIHAVCHGPSLGRSGQGKGEKEKGSEAHKRIK